MASFVLYIEYLYRNQTRQDNFRSTFVYCRKRSRTVSINCILSLKFEVYNHFRRHFTTANQLHYEQYNENIIINVNNERLSNLMLHLLGWVGYFRLITFHLLNSLQLQCHFQINVLKLIRLIFYVTNSLSIIPNARNFKICSQIVSP